MFQMYDDRLFGNYLTMTFSEVYPSYEDFEEDAKNDCSVLIPTDFTDNSLNVLYALLYAKYGNNPIAASDVNRFRFQLFSIVFQHGATWQKKVELQKAIRLLSISDAQTGTKTIDNHAFNPPTEPSTATLEELPYIDAQNTSGRKKGTLETYAEITRLLEDDVTENFISRFRVLFNYWASPQRPLWYTNYPLPNVDDVDGNITNENL